MANLINKLFNKKTTYTFQITAINLDTSITESFELDSIAFNNWMMYNYDYEVLKVEKIENRG